MSSPAPGTPRFGHAHGLPVHLRTLDHLPRNGAAARFNSWLAVKITKSVGSMYCAYVFALLALLSLPAVLTASGFVPKGFFPHWLVAAGLIALVAWIAQTFLQLVLLSIIIVGQDVQSQASDARAAKTFEDGEQTKTDVRAALNLLDLDTEGGLAVVLAKVEEVNALARAIRDTQARR